MRASTLFALTVAVLVGLGVAVAARMSGYFSPPQKAAPEPVAKKPEILVLVASRNLFAGDLVNSSDVRVRPLKTEEAEHYQQYKEQYVPPVLAATSLRVTSKNIEADQPILRGSLKDMVKPEALNARMLPRMRATSLSLSKERSAGGLIQIGEWVDVLFTTKIERPGFSTVRTACVVPHVRVIAKRNTLWPVFAPLPDDKPVQYTLELNPYRAALLDYCLNKGQLTLAPLPASEQKKLEAQRTAQLEQLDDASLVSFAPDSHPESEDESARVDAFNRGELVVSEGDLIRIFDVKQPSTPPPPLAVIQVERLSGLQRFESAMFNADGSPIPSSRASAGRPRQGPQLHNHDGLQFSEPYCPTCAEKKKAKGG
jgi:Flp pilus assembly protein CpaB